MDEHKLKCSHYLKMLQSCEDDKAKTFAIVCGQCSDAVKHKLKAHPDHADMSANANVIKLVNRIKLLMLGDDEEQYIFWNLVLSTVRLHDCKQGAKESLEAFFTRWTTQIQIHETKWGAYAPTNAIGSQGAAKDKSKFQACLFLQSIDQVKYGGILQDLNNSFLRGNKAAYPKTTDEAIKMITHWSSNNSNRKYKGHYEETPQVALAQFQEESTDEQEEIPEVEVQAAEEEMSQSETPGHEFSWQL